MKGKTRSFLLRYGISAALGALLTWLVLDLHGYADLTTAAERYRLLSNAFTIPGAILAMVGLLVIISGTGVYDGLGYALRWLRMTLLPFDSVKHERYGDYVLRKREKPRLHGGFLVIVGLLFLAVAVVFLVLFYRVW